MKITPAYQITHSKIKIDHPGDLPLSEICANSVGVRQLPFAVTICVGREMDQNGCKLNQHVSITESVSNNSFA